MCLGGLRGSRGTADFTGSSVSEDSLDVGDEKSNELVLSCSHFRNELGGEPQRTVALTHDVVTSRQQGGARNDLVHSPVCNGVAVLSSDGMSQQPLLLHNNFVLEYVDQGAFYYRKFFYNYGTL